ncbi:hypothetical protein [Paenibacillus brevis]|uniref:Phage portal protein n=1 Tax=Paenibacillus brevis TaxID=2841508 RepID=A0ABS6FT95_9BACL|nr:hypothetical protein [Paenibacillus brevis]MBU5673204.1 hypothetical protein [Paenibacillus brevis]
MIDMKGIRTLVGRPLTEQEQRHIAWINGWDREARESFVALIKAAYWNGAKEGGETVKASVSGMTEQDIKQFAEALAVRYKQIVDADLAAKIACINDQTPENALREAEAFAQYRFYSEMLDIIPKEIRLVFNAAYDALGYQVVG